MGEISLLHSLSSAMPPPGYSSDRPHIFVLTLQSGSSYFFQAGTEDLVAEWVMTCNYWAARLSKEPLTGGVSNMEYGWNRVLPAAPLGDGDDDDEAEEIASIRSGKSGRSARSGKSSRSKHSQASSMAFGSSYSNSNERAHINDWKAPQPPTAPSTLHEEAQIESLRKHVNKLESELEAHNELRSPMTRLVSIVNVCSTSRILMLFSVVLEQISQRKQSSRKLAEKIAISLIRDRQVHRIHTFTRSSDGHATVSISRQNDAVPFTPSRWPNECLLHSRARIARRGAD